MQFQLVIDANVVLPETPIWDHRINRLYWTDLFGGDIHRYDPVTGVDERWHTGEILGSAIPCDDPTQLLVVMASGLYLLDLTTGACEHLADPENNPDNRYNDSRVDARGRVLMSSVSMKYTEPDFDPLTMTGGLYLVDVDGSCRTIETGIVQYNTILWNHDNTKMLVVDTYNQKLLSFDYDLDVGPVSGPTVVIDFHAQGMPDGMSIDEADNLYVCHWTGIISVWDKHYRLVKTIPFPVEYATCGGFAGADMCDFYVASSKYRYTDAQCAANPGAGGLFIGRSAIPGMPDHFFPIRKK